MVLKIALLAFSVFLMLFPHYTTVSVNAQENSAIDNMDPNLKKLLEIDKLLTVSLVGTLAGLSLSAASFLLTGARSYLKEELSEKREELLERKDQLSREQIKPRDQQNEIKKREFEKEIKEMGDGIIETQSKIINIRNGGKSLLTAFYIFIGNLISLLVLFDSTFEAELAKTLVSEIFSVAFEGIPFLLGLAFLTSGAYNIKKVFGLEDLLNELKQNPKLK